MKQPSTTPHTCNADASPDERQHPVHRDVTLLTESGEPRPEFDADTLVTFWPGVGRSLHQMLSGRGCSHADREDIIQETAARILQHHVRFHDEIDLRRYALTTAARIHLNTLRSFETVDIDSVAPAELISCGLDTTVEHRLAITLIMAELHRLSAADRALLLSPTKDPSDPTKANRNYVRRHRIRAKLRLIISGLIALQCLTTVANMPRPCITSARAAIRPLEQNSNGKRRLTSLAPADIPVGHRQRVSVSSEGPVRPPH